MITTATAVVVVKKIIMFINEINNVRANYLIIAPIVSFTLILFEMEP